VHRVANHAEQLVDRLLIRELFLDIRLAEAPQQKIADLVARSKPRAWARLELHAERLFDLGDVGFDFVGVGALSGASPPRQAEAASNNKRDGSSHYCRFRATQTSCRPSIRPRARCRARE
jgi:hypothetical protein